MKFEDIFTGEAVHATRGAQNITSEGIAAENEIFKIVENAICGAIEVAMDFILDDGFQSVIPTTNWMYPAGKASVPDAFGDLISPAKSLLFTPEQVAQNKSAWVAEWQGALSQ